jgi:hypothetical protein
MLEPVLDCASFALASRITGSASPSPAPAAPEPAPAPPFCSDRFWKYANSAADDNPSAVIRPRKKYHWAPSRCSILPPNMPTNTNRTNEAAEAQYRFIAAASQSPPDRSHRS